MQLSVVVGNRMRVIVEAVAQRVCAATDATQAPTIDLCDLSVPGFLAATGAVAR